MPLEISLTEQCLRETAGSVTTIWLETSLPRISGPSFPIVTASLGKPVIASSLALLKSLSRLPV
jgi:hypothetical protein